MGASGRTWPEAKPSTTSCRLSWHCWQHGGVSRGLFSVQNRQKYFSFLMPVSSTEGQGVGSCGLEMRSQNDEGAWALPRYKENCCESRTFLLEMCFLRTVECDPSVTKQWALWERGPSLRTLQTCVRWQVRICMVAHTLTRTPTHMVIYIWASWNSDPHGYSASMLPNEPSPQAFPSQLFLNCLPWKPSLSFLLGRTEKDIKNIPFGIRKEAYT